MKINDIMFALVAELAEGEVPSPLRQRFNLASLWADLARLAGEELPAEVAALVDAALGVTIEPVAVLAMFDRSNFTPAYAD